MKRIFIAVKVEPGDNLLQMISSLKTRLGNESIKWTDPGNIHITLSFLGDTEEEKIKPVSDMLNEICKKTGEFEFTLNGAGVFKNISDPRVIWAGIEPSPQLQDLNEKIINGLKRVGVRMENRPFRPHLTLGRIRNIKDKNLLNSLIDEFQDYEIQKVSVSEVILYESILLQSGPVYKPLSINKLQ